MLAAVKNNGRALVWALLDLRPGENDDIVLAALMRDGDALDFLERFDDDFEDKEYFLDLAESRGIYVEDYSDEADEDEY